MELELKKQSNLEQDKSNNLQNQKNIDNKNVDLLVEEDVSVENQNKFLETTLGKTINTAIDIGLRGIMPDMIEDQIIEIKNILIKNRVKRRN